MTRPTRSDSLATAVCLAVLLLAGCAPTTPARQEQMVLATSPAAEAGAEAPVEAPVEARLGSVYVTVFGDVGGFASHYYPLPREDFEAALIESMATGGVFRPVQRADEPAYLVTVGLVQMTAPHWSGRVTLETSWSVTSTATGEKLGRQAIEATAPAEFSKKREATEAAAQMNIAEGLAWLEQVIEANSAR